MMSYTNEILGELAAKHPFALDQAQRNAWIEEIEILKVILNNLKGMVYFEFSVPRMGKRIDAVVIIDSVVFVLEFKVGEKVFAPQAIDQVFDYALDLKNFHETSHEQIICPILIATKARPEHCIVATTPQNDKLFYPVTCNNGTLPEIIKKVLEFSEDETIDPKEWEKGRYCPTPTIIEAAMALYNGHSVEEISRSDASAVNLSQTSEEISSIIISSKENFKKSICFVTGVPGAGKTLIGLNIATKHFDKSNDLYSVFLSGNGPLVSILREALVRDKVSRLKEQGKKPKKGEVMSEVKIFIQNVHHFRDDCLINLSKPPIEHVALFDEAQRAWNKEQTILFMRQSRKNDDFNMSEPEFLISCFDRHSDWATIVCLLGGGQEINRGEAGIDEWIDSLIHSFPDWDVYISPRLTDTEYSNGESLKKLQDRNHVFYRDNLHLSVSMRSFRAEHISLLVKQLLDMDIEGSRRTLNRVRNQYPIMLTRKPSIAKNWLKQKARGSERYGIVVSSQAERLKPHAIDVKSPVNPIHWFLEGKEDVRSSYYLESVATEFRIQGLELDWVCVTWDADFRYSENSWICKSFRGDRWFSILKQERKVYLKNAYRVLLTRARQGMIIVVPEGDKDDATRMPEFYDSTFEYLKKIGFDVIEE